MKFTLQCLSFFMVFILVIERGSALFCYQCDSTLDSNCQERWDAGLTVNENYYTRCQLWDAKYCAKITGMWGGIVGTHRFCASKDLGDQCQDIWFRDHDRMYRACVYSCEGDGCNSAKGLTSLSALSLSLLAVLVGALRLL